MTSRANFCDLYYGVVFRFRRSLKSTRYVKLHYDLARERDYPDRKIKGIKEYASVWVKKEEQQ